MYHSTFSSTNSVRHYKHHHGLLLNVLYSLFRPNLNHKLWTNYFCFPFDIVQHLRLNSVICFFIDEQMALICPAVTSFLAPHTVELDQVYTAIYRNSR